MKLVLRDTELGWLEELFATARRGSGDAALVTGSPGTGKSALLHAFAGRTGRRGALVLTASASAAEAGLPLGVVGQLLSGAAPETVRTEAYDNPEGAPAALHATLRELAAARPVVVLVDDAQYTDEASARCLLYLCGRLASAGILLVLACGPVTGPAPALPLPLAELLRHPRCAPVPLTVLDEAGVAEVLAAAVPDAGGPAGAGGVPAAPAAAWRSAVDWYRLSGGNPRLLHGLLEDRRACETAPAAPPSAGTAFRRAVTACLRSAGPHATAAARALAVLAEAATPGLLARLLGLHEPAVGPCLDELDAMGLLDGGRLRHEGVCAAVLGVLPVDEAAALHARAAALLYDAGAEPGLVARQLVAASESGGGRPGPQWAAPLLAEAARHALRSGEPGRAAEFLRTAAGRDGGARDGQLLELLARAEWETGPGSVTRHLTALEQELAAGRLDGTHAEGALGLLLWHGRPAAVARTVTGRVRVPSVEGLGRALGHLYPGLAPLPVPDEDRGETAERVLESLVYDHAPPASIAALLSALVHAAETDRVDQWCALTAGVERMRSSPARRAVAEAAAAVVRIRTGAYDSAAGHAGRALSLLSPGAWGVALGMPLAAAVLTATRRGALDAAARQLQVPVPESMFATRAGMHYLLARGHYQLAVGRPRAALGDFHACRDALAAWHLAPVGALDWRPAAAEAVRAGGGPAGSPVARLSAAERRVAVLAADGCTNRAIAARLYVTPSTVEQHLTRIYRKLRVTSRDGLTDLVAAGSHG
ncbi:AAA family ATPase [Streptomyces sp. NPDC021093]|uniref:helix-turn-helix transcriptional regulator n=1 Tax=Streptomyces sp. NPDC021093 TaxID=3365112 RepID=UPI0037A74DD1